MSKLSSSNSSNKGKKIWTVSETCSVAELLPSVQIRKSLL